MAFERVRQVFLGDTPPVVRYLDEFFAALFDEHVDAVGVGVDGVFHEFLDHAGRAFYDLSGRDLVDQVRGQFSYLFHRGYCIKWAYAFKENLPVYGKPRLTIPGFDNKNMFKIEEFSLRSFYAH